MIGFSVLAMVIAGPSRHVAAQPAEPASEPTAPASESAGPASEPTGPASESPEPPPPGEPVLHAASVAGAPLPGAPEVSGVSEPADRGVAPTLRWIPRVVLFVPRWAFVLASQPVRGGAWVYERFEIRDRAKRVFFNDAETFGLYPVAFQESGFGLNIGGRMIMRDVFGAGEGLKARVGYGGRFRQLYAVSLSTGERLGRVTLDLDAEFDIRGKDRFFGIGNQNLSASEDLPANPMIDALGDDTAVATRFRQDVAQVNLGTELDVVGGVSIKASTGWIRRSFDRPGDLASNVAGVDIGEVYDLDSLVGFGEGLSAAYAELELAYDSRRAANRFVARDVHSTGWLLAGYAGVTQGVGDDPSNYTRYGVDLQRYFDLFRGTRVVALRFFAEGVSGDVDKVPFVDLPRLGGGQLLRGHDSDRFRDRAMTLLSAEYEWDLNNRTYSFLFVDAGRVWRSFRDIDADGLRDTRVGFGGGIQLLSMKSFLARLELSTSIDGGFFFNFGFDPAYDRLSRRRK